MASCSYLAGGRFDGENDVTGNFVHIADLEASCGPVPNQNIGEDKLVLISDEHALVLHHLQDLAEVDAAADPMLLKDGLYVVNHKCCKQTRGRAEDGETFILNLSGPCWPLRAPFLPRSLQNPTWMGVLAVRMEVSHPQSERVLLSFYCSMHPSQPLPTGRREKDWNL